MMKLLQRKKNKAARPDNGGAIVLSIDSSSRGLEFLIELVKKIRPSDAGNIKEAELKFQAMLYQLQQDRSLIFSLRRSLLSQFQHSEILTALTASGIVSSRGFVQELIIKLQHKMLPALQKPNDFLYVLNRIFYLKTDYKWVGGINKELWKNFFELLGIQINLTDPRLTGQLQQALQILSYRAATTGLEKEIASRLETASNATYPFLEQNRLVSLYLERYSHGQQVGERKLLINNIGEALYNCLQSIQWIKEQRKEHGTSLAQTFLLVRLEQEIERMFIILDVLDSDQQFNTERFIQYFSTVIRNENRKNSLGEFLSDSLGMLAYQIAEHKGRKGEAYISVTRRDYILLFRSAMGGGLIISFIAIFKNLLGKIPVAPFWGGLFYSINYSFGFVLMDQTRTTLATKQPAYTASALAGSLDSSKLKGKPDLHNLAIAVARVARSQIASFAGNLLVVFPLTYIFAALYHMLFGIKIAEGIAAEKLLLDQHPWQSLALLYACFTGFFLFVSGLIAGYIENSVVYGNVPERLKTHPVLSATMSKKRLDKLVRLVKNSSGAFAGSVALGFFLGIAGPLGKIMGLPFDIRHITISAGNTAIGFYGLDHQVSPGYLFTIISGVLMIGFLNFIVSFSFAFYVAVRSRGIRLKEYTEFFGILRRYFAKYPADFIRPPRDIRQAKDLA